MIAGAIQTGFFMWAWYAWQPYFLELLERDAVWVAGVVAFLDMALAVAVMWIMGGHSASMLPVLFFPVATSVLYLAPETGLDRKSVV